MKILVSGSSGFIGSSLVSYLEAGSHEVSRLVRSAKRKPAADGLVFYDADSGVYNPRDFEQMDAVIHLAGHGVMRRWTSSAKKAIEQSRVASTEFLASVFSNLDRPPKVFLCASAVGFYGHRGDEILKEESGPGEGFLAQVAVRWEKAANAASSDRTRVASLRFGMVLEKNGGALGMIKIPFKLGLGGTIGDGSDYISWISLYDAMRAVEFILTEKTVSGPVNIVAPVPVRSGDFSSTLARVVKRPAFLPLKKSAVKFVCGQMGEEVIMSSARVFPGRLLKAGFSFSYEKLEDFLYTEFGGRNRGKA